jgi:biofilm protein TabA
MILDRLANADLYAPLHPGFAAAFRFLRETDLAAWPDGEHELDGRRLYVSVTNVQGRGRSAAKVEAHRRYIDIHFVVRGCEEIGLKPAADCQDVELEYDSARDLTLFRDRPESWMRLPAGSFAIFYPDDGHAPLAMVEAIRKAVVKVQVGE